MARSLRWCRIRPHTVLGALLCLSACQRTTPDEATAGEAPARTEPTESTEPTEPAAESIAERTGEPRWRTTFAFDERIRGDGASDAVRAAPLIEVIDHIRGDARTIFAVHRRDAEPSLRIEHWRFATRGPAGLNATGEPEPLLRLDRDDPPAEGLQEFRVFAATPGNKVLRRDSGLESVDALLASLAKAAKTARDPAAAGDDRVAALGELVADLDDTLVLERDVLYRVLDTFAGGPPEILSREEISARRARLLIDGGRGPRQIEALKLRQGWLLRDLRLPVDVDKDEGSGGRLGTDEAASESAP